MISYEEFQALSATYNVIPLVQTQQADLHTPVSTYLALRREGVPSFLLESVERDEKIGRFSFVGIDPALSLRESPSGVTLHGDGESIAGNIFDALAAYGLKYRQAPVLPGGAPGAHDEHHGLAGGFVGYLGYDAVRHLEHLPAIQPSGGSRFDLFGSVVRFDHRLQSLMIIQNVFVPEQGDLRKLYDDGRKSLQALELRLRRSVVGTSRFEARLDMVEECTSREVFCASVEKAKRHIYDGDIFQVVLSRNVRLPFQGDLFAAYRALRVINPSPYLFYLDFGQTRLAGSSPEVLVRVHDRTVELLPIAGTRGRGGTEEDDRRLELELLDDPKENAEHVMLVDLGRNDVGRVSAFGSVDVPVLRRVDRYSHVMHIVSHVRGKLRADLGPVDALRASFPAGTVSGAPKVRAMEIINALEGRPRGLYAGAVGYLGLNGTLDTCITIRTILAQGDMLTIQTGAGIVADSDPEAEYEETVRKGRAMFDALQQASGGRIVP